MAVVADAVFADWACDVAVVDVAGVWVLVMKSEASSSLSNLDRSGTTSRLPSPTVDTAVADVAGAPDELAVAVVAVNVAVVGGEAWIACDDGLVLAAGADAAAEAGLGVAVAVVAELLSCRAVEAVGMNESAVFVDVAVAAGCAGVCMTRDGGVAPAACDTAAAVAGWAFDVGVCVAGSASLGNDVAVVEGDAWGVFDSSGVGAGMKACADVAVAGA